MLIVVLLWNIVMIHQPILTVGTPCFFSYLRASNHVRAAKNHLTIGGCQMFFMFKRVHVCFCWFIGV